MSHWYHDPDQSRIYGREAYELSVLIKDSTNMSNALRVIGVGFYTGGNLDKALSYSLRASEIAIQIKDTSLIRKSYNNLGLYYFKLGVNSLALEHLLRAEQMILNAQNQNGYSDLLNIIGLVYYEAGKITLANSYFEKSIEMAGEEDFNDVIDARIYLGMSFIQLQNSIEAMHHLRKAYQMAKKENNKFAMTRSWRYLGDNYRVMRYYDSAEWYLKKSYDLSTEISDSEGLIDTNLCLARLSLDQSEYDISLDFLRENEPVLRELNIPTDLHQKHFELKSEVFAQLKLWDSAALFLGKALDLKNEMALKSRKANLDLVPLKIRDEQNQMEIIRKEERLKNANSQNQIYLIVLIGSSIFLIVLFIILRMTLAARKKLAHVNEQLVVTRDLLIRSEKMASIGILVSGVGHEINNPLNFIQSGVKMLYEKLDEKLDSDEEVERVKKYIDEGVNRTSKIVLGLTKLARLEKNTKTSCELSGIIDQCLAALEDKLQGIKVLKAYSSQVHMMVNEELFRQLFNSILTNAIYAMDENGPDRKLSINMHTEDNKVTVQFEDNGEGISEENLLRVCDPFFTTKPPGKGLGLGLYVGNLIVQEYDGHMDFESVVNLGTVVSICFPLQAADTWES